MTVAEFDTIRNVINRVRDSVEPGDAELLLRYRRERDPEAFGALVRRHGPMVLGVCRRVLRDTHAADDAFQVTFLVLAKRADEVRFPERLAPWLFGVASRTALKARGRISRGRQVEQVYATEWHGRPSAPLDESAELLPIIDEQLVALPEKYRTPLVLCALHGLNKAEAAQRLGLPEGTVSSRLARAREMLRTRLARRGIVVPAVALANLLAADALRAAVSPVLAASTSGSATGSAPVSATVLTLSNEVLRSMLRFRFNALCSVVMCVVLAGGFGLYALRADDKEPVPPGAKSALDPVELPGPARDTRPAQPGARPDPNEKNDPGKRTADEKKPVRPDGENPSSDRIKLVRQMYEKLPCGILGVTEPSKQVTAQGFLDGGTIQITVRDAKDNKLVLRLDRQLQTKTRDALFLTTKAGEVRLPARGPEESAVYGLLLRCTTKPPEGTPGDTLALLGDVLKVLDERFAGAAPIGVEK
jgi:RNA polymerase sigma factor (sigma-70 family)